MSKTQKFSDGRAYDSRPYPDKRIQSNNMLYTRKVGEYKKRDSKPLDEKEKGKGAIKYMKPSNHGKDKTKNNINLEKNFHGNQNDKTHNNPTQQKYAKRPTIFQR